MIGTPKVLNMFPQSEKTGSMNNFWHRGTAALCKQLREHDQKAALSNCENMTKKQLYQIK